MPPFRTAILSLVLAASALCHCVMAQETGVLVPAEPVGSPSQEFEDTATSAPEPNATVLAAIGGLALLFFALRRK